MADDQRPKDTGEIGARTRAQVEELLEYYERDRTRIAWGKSVDDHYAGVIAIFQWCAGKQASPAKGLGCTGPRRTYQEMNAEARAVDDAFARPSQTGHSRNYWAGAQHALMWVRGECEDRPLLD